MIDHAVGGVCVSPSLHVRESLSVGPYLVRPLTPTGGMKVRKGGVRMGWSLWLGVEQKSGSPSPSLSPAPGDWGAWGLGHRGGSHQLSLEAVGMDLVGRGSRAKSGFSKTW